MLEDISDAIHSIEANTEIVAIETKRQYSTGMRSRYAFDDNNPENAAVPLFTTSTKELLRRPLVVHFLRAHVPSHMHVLIDIFNATTEWPNLSTSERISHLDVIIHFAEKAKNRDSSKARALSPKDAKIGFYDQKVGLLGGASDDEMSDTLERGVQTATWEACLTRLRGLAASATEEAPAADALAEVEDLAAKQLAPACMNFTGSAAFYNGHPARFISLLAKPVRHDAFFLVRPIGKGSYGQVWFAVKRDTGAFYALKMLSRRKLKGEVSEHHALDEHRALRQVSSPFVNELHYAYATERCVCLVLGWLSGGTLAFHLKARRKECDEGTREWPFEQGDMRYYGASCCLALEALHAVGVIHRDIKPDNLLLDRGGRLRVADFGLSCLLNKDEGEAAYSKSGSRGYWAPELIRRKPYRHEADWWSLGVTLHSLLSMHSPFSISSSKAASKRGSLSFVVAGQASSKAGDGIAAVPEGSETASGGGAAEEGRGWETLTLDARMDAIMMMEDEEDEDEASPRRRRSSTASKRRSVVKEEGLGKVGTKKKSSSKKKRDEVQDQLILEYEPPPPLQLSASGVSLLGRLLDKEQSTRLGYTGGAREVMSHPFFGGFDWLSLRNGTMPPPLLPANDTVFTGDIKDMGGTEEKAVDQQYSGVHLDPGDIARFAHWEWKDSQKMEREIVNAIEWEGVAGYQLTWFERWCSCCVH